MDLLKEETVRGRKAKQFKRDSCLCSTTYSSSPTFEIFRKVWACNSVGKCSAVSVDALSLTLSTRVGEGRGGKPFLTFANAHKLRSVRATELSIAPPLLKKKKKNLFYLNSIKLM
jgi:hypothetical protein